jgi:hypothetical protein
MLDWLSLERKLLTDDSPVPEPSDAPKLMFMGAVRGKYNFQDSKD